MRGQVTLQVTMELLSDAIFGSGFSVPGGEDIAVYKDAAGYPLVKGSTFKGLLRESMGNFLTWTGGQESDLIALLGESGWPGPDESRRIHLTDLTLEDPPADPSACYSDRAFSRMEDGVAVGGSLRFAACVHSGVRFSGQLTCSGEDVPLVQQALMGIKWAGTMRGRGFGRVRVRGAAAEEHPAALPGIASARCIRYRLRTETPVLVTDLARSRENTYATRDYLPGSAIRGMVISTLAAEHPTWFQEHRTALLSEQTRFLSAVPTGIGVPIPSICGFYEDKVGENFRSIVNGNSFTDGMKRASLGTFCSLDGETVRFWRAATDGATRISRDLAGAKKGMFQTYGICAGQELEGYILLEDPSLAEAVAGALEGTVWLGADRCEGFGKCLVVFREAVDQPAWIQAYGCRTQAEVDATLYLLALSPVTMLDMGGEPCGLDLEALAEKLGIGKAELCVCATTLTESGGFNRVWGSRVPAAAMYDQGSIFRLACDRAPSLEKLRAVEREGLGIRRGEGFGQVLFLRRGLFEGLRRKEAVKSERGTLAGTAAAARRQRYRWVMEHDGELAAGKLSRSQLGELQDLCVKAIARGGDLTELNTYLEKNLTGRGVRHGERFRRAGALIRQVLDTPLPQTIRMGDVPCADSTAERLKLLCLLLTYSRGGKE